MEPARIPSFVNQTKASTCFLHPEPDHRERRKGTHNLAALAGVIKPARARPAQHELTAQGWAWAGHTPFSRGKGVWSGGEPLGAWIVCSPAWGGVRNLNAWPTLCWSH